MQVVLVCHLYGRARHTVDLSTALSYQQYLEYQVGRMAWLDYATAL